LQSRLVNLARILLGSPTLAPCNPGLARLIAPGLWWGSIKRGVTEFCLGLEPP
jgi:hypothetical protein